MRAVFAGVLVGGWAMAVAAHGAGLAHNENFIVVAADQTLADEVLFKAERFRRDIAREWLERELPPSVGRTIIHVEFSGAEDSGLTWAIDSPGRQYHKLWLGISSPETLDPLLAHEIAHIVFATRYPRRLPAWVEEGIASRYDGRQRVGVRRDILQWYAQTDNWPSLRPIVAASAVIAEDQATYSVSVSATEYLLSLSDKATLLAFAETAKTDGCDRALRRHYQIAGVDALQRAWQRWAAERLAGE